MLRVYLCLTPPLPLPQHHNTPMFLLSLAYLLGFSHVASVPTVATVSLTFRSSRFLCSKISISPIHYHVALARPALSPSVVLNYSFFLGQALVSSYCNDFLIICLYVMNEMEMYHHCQTGVWHHANLFHHSQGGWDQGVASNKTDKHIQLVQVTCCTVYGFNKTRNVWFSHF